MIRLRFPGDGESRAEPAFLSNRPLNRRIVSDPNSLSQGLLRPTGLPNRIF